MNKVTKLEAQYASICDAIQMNIVNKSEWLTVPKEVFGFSYLKVEFEDFDGKKSSTQWMEYSDYDNDTMTIVFNRKLVQVMTDWELAFTYIGEIPEGDNQLQDQWVIMKLSAQQKSAFALLKFNWVEKKMRNLILRTHNPRLYKYVMQCVKLGPGSSVMAKMEEFKKHRDPLQNVISAEGWNRG